MKKERILHLEAEKYPEESLNILESHFRLFKKVIQDQYELNKILNQNQYKCIFTRLGLNLYSENLKNQKSLGYIVTPTTGLNHIDLDYTKSKNIKIISLKNETKFLRQITSTAEHTWSLILNLVRKINETALQVKAGSWSRVDLSIDELYGMSIGIIGYGRLGKIVSEYAKAFKMNVFVFDIDINAYKNIDKCFTIVNSVDELVKTCDIVTLHIPYNKENINFYSKNLFDKMKTDSYFINTSRGEVVDEKYLLRVLSKKLIKGAAVDVLKDDSVWIDEIPKDNSIINYLNKNNNLLVTPHIGGYGVSSIKRTREFITSKFIKIYNEKNL